MSPSLPPEIATLHPLRTAGRALAARVVADAQSALVRAGDGACTDRAIARRLRLNKNVPATRAREGSGVAIALGDVLALPRALARDVLTRALASLEEPAQSGPSEDATIALITIALGQAVEGLHADLADDGTVNRHEQHATAFSRIASIALRGYLAALRRGAR